MPNEKADQVHSIVLIHGIGGHPVRSWKCHTPPPTEPPRTPKSVLQTSSSVRRRLLRTTNPPLRRSNSEPLLSLGVKHDSTGRSRNVLRKNSLKKSPSSATSSRTFWQSFLDKRAGRDGGREGGVYWPLDLLPDACPSARILVWGFHTLLGTDGRPLRLQDDIFAHAKDLLADLGGFRDTTGTESRGVVFIAHSTGGILVKEVCELRGFNHRLDHAPPS
jgi:hypothetical protein